MWSTLLVLCWVAAVKSLCPTDLLAEYKIVVHTEWSEERFPKQYPKWRPPAQWSLVVGRSHNSSHRLWRLGDPASDAVKQFAETGKTEILFRETIESKRGILSEFFAPPITQGVGRTETKFFVDGNHSKVSLMCRLVPSPDWFVGIDSFDLCTGKQWVDAVTLDLDPIDAGTDNGFTFTSPNWDTEPREPMIQITARFPRHPASSFFYPDLKKLPRIAYLRLIKMKEYSLTQEFSRDPKDELNAETVLTTLSAKEELMDEFKMLPITVETRRSSEGGLTTKSGGKGRRKVESSLLNALGPKSEKDPSLRKKRRKAHGGDKPKIRTRGPRPCRVTDWSEWGLCSQTCGFGEQTRSRKVFKHAVRGGRPCPPLEETRWCGSARTCRNDTSTYFKW